MRSFWSVAFAVAWRVLHNVFTTPSLFLPGMIFPLFFFTAFAGGLSRVENIPGFDFPNGYTAFQFVFVLLQSAAFGGVFTGFSVAADFEYGFGRRLLLAAPKRSAILTGYLIAALIRACFACGVVFAAALIGGMHVDGSALDLVGLLGLALLVNATAALWAFGIALRFRSIQAGAAALARPLGDCVRLGQDAPATPQQVFASGGQVNAATDAIEERDAQRALERADLARCRGLREVQA